MSVSSNHLLTVVVNGEAAAFAQATSVADLLTTRGLAGKRVAVERNGEIVPRSRHAVTLLASDDRLEIVVAVGGG
jgi:sulfur carrier protein